jgi:hypothetical protein
MLTAEMLRQSTFCDRSLLGIYLTSTRKLRNRVSQQAFRRRQSEYIKQLERKAKAYKPDNERIIELEEENTLLRESLTQCHNKLESLRTTIYTPLSDIWTRVPDGTSFICRLLGC